MTKHIVTQGEVGVAAGDGIMATYGACPCVILGVLDGVNCMLIHVHVGNSYASINGAVAGFKDGSENKDGVTAFISTETSIDDAEDQRRSLTNVENALKFNDVPIAARYDKSAALVTKNKFVPESDETVVNLVDGPSSVASMKRAMAADAGLQKGGAKLSPAPAP